jgi:hypothetical protein
MPSRRWPGRVVPDRLTGGGPGPSRNQRPTPRPTAAPVDVRQTGCGVGPGSEGRDGRDAPREPAFDLVERVPDRAAVLLAMVPSLVA